MSGGSLDMSKAGNAIWLVKVPKYVADKWDNAPGSLDVGKIKVTNTPGKRPDISLHLSEAVLCLEGEKNNEPIPKSFKLDVSHFSSQTMVALSEHRMPYNPDAVVQETDRLAILGKISQKLECRPIGDQVIVKYYLYKFFVIMIPQWLYSGLYGFKKTSYTKSTYSNQTSSKVR